jgi:hypothetical protein
MDNVQKVNYCYSIVGLKGRLGGQSVIVESSATQNFQICYFCDICGKHLCLQTYSILK